MFHLKKQFPTEKIKAISIMEVKELPVMRVKAVIAIITHHKDIAFGHNLQLAIDRTHKKKRVKFVADRQLDNTNTREGKLDYVNQWQMLLITTGSIS